MLVEQQIAERRERARSAVAKILERPSGEIYGDYRVQSTSGKTYRVAMRGPGEGSICPPALRPFLFQDFERKTFLQLHAGRRENGANRASGATLLADHLAEVGSVNPKFKDRDLFTLD